MPFQAQISRCRNGPTPSSGSPNSTSMEIEMNRFLLAAATLALVAGTALAPAIAAAPPGSRASSEGNWPGMTQSTSSGYVTDAATGARFPVYTTHHAAPIRDNYDSYTGPNVADPQASPIGGPGQFIPRTR